MNIQNVQFKKKKKKKKKVVRFFYFLVIQTLSPFYNFANIMGILPLNVLKQIPFEKTLNEYPIFQGGKKIMNGISS